MTRYAAGVLEFADAHGWKIIAVLAVVGALPPLFGLEGGFYMTVATLTLMFGVLALSWDLIGGQTGYPSFGQMGFFGLGAYTTAILVKDQAVAFPVAFLVAGVLATLAAGVVGLIVLRLRGGYFAIATLGILLVAQQVSRNLEVTGGSSGKILLDVPPATTFYYVLLGLLVAEVAVVYYLTGTRFGYVLNAIRDDEGKATSMGVNTTYYKTAAWMLAALFTGLAGGSWSLFNTFVDPNTAYNLSWNVEMIAMALLGGTGTVAGPVLGAFGLHLTIVFIQSVSLDVTLPLLGPTTINFAGWQLVLLGLVVIVTVVSYPQGFVGELRERASAMEYYRHAGGAAGQETSHDETASPDGGERT